MGVARTEEFRTLLQHAFNHSVKDDMLNVLLYTCVSMMSEEDIDRLRGRMFFVMGSDLDKPTRRMTSN